MRWIIGIIILIIAACLSTNSIFLLLLIGLLFALLIQQLQFYLIKKHLIIESTMQNTAFRNDKFPIQLTVWNKLPVILSNAVIKINYTNLLTKQQQLIEIPLSIGFFGQQKINNLIHFESFGIVKSDEVTVQLNGFFTKTFTRTLEQQVTIWPRLYEVDFSHQSDHFRLQTSQAEKLQPTKFLGDESFGFRPYEIGDPVSHIHWKLSFKEDDLVVMDQHLYQESDFLLCLHAQNDTRTRQVELIELYLSVAQMLISRGLQASIWLNNQIYSLRHYTLDEIQALFFIDYDSHFPKDTDYTRIIVTSNTAYTDEGQEAIIINLQEEKEVSKHEG